MALGELHPCYASETKRSIIWNVPKPLEISWPAIGTPFQVSLKDEQAPCLQQATLFQ